MDDRTQADASSGGGSGRVLHGRYRIDRVLGQGGLGTVYRGMHLGLDRPVAVKMLHPELLANEELRKRFDREVKMLSRLSHPHIVSLVDSGVLEDGSGYLVMELLEGEALDARIERSGPLDPDAAIDVARQTLRGLSEAHDKAVLHRDVKPANVFLVPMAQGVHVKLLDFGLAKVRNDLATDPGRFPTLTATGMIVGTPTYMAPEQASLEGGSAASDLYSVGIVLYEMLAGRPPFRHENKVETIRAHMGEPVPELDAMDPALHPTEELRAFFRCVLAKKPSDRFPHARAMLKALDALPKPPAVRDAPGRPSGPSAEKTFALGSGELLRAEIMQGSTIPDAPPPVVPRPPPPPRRWPFLAAAAAVLFALPILVWAATRTELERPPPGAAPAPSPAPPIEQAEDSPPPEEGGAANPFVEGALPEELRDARREILRGRRLSEAQIGEVEAYARAHPDDSRALLLLARHERFGAHWSEMTERYLAAHAADPSSTGFAPMLSDLIRAAGDPQASTLATAALARLYGPNALPAVDARLTELEPGPEHDLIDALRARLAGP